MGHRIATLVALSFMVGCATPPPPTQLMGAAPSRGIPRMIVTGGGSSAERVERAESECQKLGPLYKATQLQLNPSPAKKPRKFQPNSADQFVCDVKPQVEMTPLQLRSIQSRLFKSTMDDVAKAIETFTKDRGGICARAGQSRMLPGGIHVNGFQLLENEIECRTLGMQYNSELSKADNGVLVRSRIYVWSHSQPSVQLTDPNEYTILFKSIADQLFIEAIQIEAAEMR